MRIVVAIVSVMSLAAVYQPAVAQTPGGYQSSSLMPMPQVAQYSAPSTGAARATTYGNPTFVPQYQGYRPAMPAYQPRSYGQMGNGWNTPRYQPSTTPARANHYNYANYSAPPQPQPQAAPAPSPNGGPAPANGNNPWLDAMSAPWGSCEGAGAAPGQSGYGSGYAAGPGYGCEPAYGAGYGAVYGGGYGDAYGYGAVAARAPSCPHWKADITALFMGRLDSNPVWFSWISGNERDQLGKGIQNQAFGFQVGLTRRFCCNAGTFGLQSLYWGLYPNTWNFERRQANLDPNVPGRVMSVYDFYPLYVDLPGSPPTPVEVNDYFDYARYHRVTRNWEVHNVEFNLCGGSLLGDGVDGWGLGAAGGGCGGAMCGTDCCGAGYGGVGYGSGLNLGWLFGVRFLYFGDALQFATDQVDHELTGDLDELYYDIDVDNHLIGLQLGFGGDWAIMPRFHLRTSTKFGIFGNHINHVSQIHGAMGNAYVSTGPNANMEFDVHSSETAVSFLGEIDLGVAYHITRRLVGTVGYRIVAVSNVAVADAQIPRHFAGIQDVADIDSKNDLILHGGYAGVEFCW